MKPSGSQLDQWELQAKELVGKTNYHDEQAIRQGAFGVVHRKALCLAYAAGADQELGACCESIRQIWELEHVATVDDMLRELRRDRRPKPLSLKEQARHALDVYVYGDPNQDDKVRTYNAIRRALDALPD